jgi:hypothetical protein
MQQSHPSHYAIPKARGQTENQREEHCEHTGVETYLTYLELARD